MARTLFSGMVLRKLSEITKSKPILISTMLFYSYDSKLSLRNAEDAAELWTTEKREVSSAKNLAFVVRPSGKSLI